MQFESPVPHVRALRVASKKMQMRMSARARNDVIEVDGSDASSEDEAEELDEIAPRRKKKGERSICNVSFSNFDFSEPCQWLAGRSSGVTSV